VKGSRGQASVEIVGCALLIALAALAIVQVLLIARTRLAAERIADQAAVLVAEGKPIPRGLRSQASIEQDGSRLTVRVSLPGSLPVGPSEATVTVQLPK
jgi:hypothetical protein